MQNALIECRLHATLTAIPMQVIAAGIANDQLGFQDDVVAEALAVGVLEFVDQVEPEDTFFESDGVKVFVDPKSLVYLDGTIVDFAREGLNEGLEFRNPNVAGECGCGESFTV